MTNMQHESLADRIYEAAVITELWVKVIAEMADVAGGQAALLSTVKANSVQMISTSEKLSETWKLVFKRFPGASNQRTQRLLAARHPGFLTDADVFSETEMDADPLYQQILIPAGFGSGVATSIRYPTDDAIVLNIERAAALGTFDLAVVQHLNGLRPHLARSALISARLAFERARTAVETLAALGLAACAVTKAGTVLVANTEFGVEGQLWTTRNGNRIALLDRRADRVLYEALGVIATEQGVRSLPLIAGQGGAPAVLHVVPIRRAAHDIFAHAAAIMVLTKASSKPTQATPLVQTLFDLSPTEATIAARIAAGETTEQIARAGGKSIETVRNQLKRVLEKTGCRRQADLARLLAQLIPAGTQA